VAIRKISWPPILFLGLFLWGGCKPRSAENLAPDHTAHREGHVYLAQLAAVHPLHADLARIDAAIRLLRTEEHHLELPRFTLGGRFGDEYIAGPVMLSWPQDVWSARRDDATRPRADATAADQTQLPPDLAAEVRGETLRAERAMREALLRSRNKAGREFAERATSLYEENLERLNALQFGREPDDATSREAIVAELEDTLTKLQERQAAELADIEAEQTRKRDQRIAQVTAEAQRKAAKRRRPPTDSSGAAKQQMIEAIAKLEPPDWDAVPELRLPRPQLPQPPQSHAALEQQRQRAREQQIELLTSRRSEITRLLFAASRVAAAKVARERRVRLHYIPDDEPVGPDMTEEFADAVGRQLSGS
jgi:hypothetical protein